MSTLPPDLAALLGVTTWPDAPRLRRAIVSATPDAAAAPLLRWSYDRARGAAARPTLAAWAAVLGVAPEALRGRRSRLRLTEALPCEPQMRAPRALSAHPEAERSRIYRAKVAAGTVGSVGQPRAAPLDDPEAQRRREADTARAAARRAATKKAAKKRRKTPSA